MKEVCQHLSINFRFIYTFTVIEMSHIRAEKELCVSFMNIFSFFLIDLNYPDFLIACGRKLNS